MELPDSFNIFCSDTLRLARNSKILAAVSGGIDSMVLCDLLLRAEYHTAVAHCNYGLRGAGSDADEAFVRQWCEERNVPFFVQRFNTSELAEQRKAGIQETARDLRYAWFEELRTGHDFDLIATGHHKDDLAETVLMNIVRGTGFAGLSGIPPRNGSVIRPLMFASRKEIEQYAAGHGIQWRHDASNDDDKYTRNRIRHHVIPVLKEVNPGFGEHLSQLSQHAAFAEKILAAHFAETWNQVAQENTNSVHLDIPRMCTFEPLPEYLFGWLSPYGFNSNQVQKIAGSLSSHSGIKFLSPTHEIFKDRSHFILRKHEAVNETDVLIHADTPFAKAGPDTFTFSTAEGADHASTAGLSLDFGKLAFPLILRTWKPGDRFVPLGMSGSKKVSDFLVDSKVPVPDKENVVVLISGTEIACIPGYRIDDRYKVDNSTQKTFMIARKQRERP